MPAALVLGSGVVGLGFTGAVGWMAFHPNHHPRPEKEE